MARTVKTGTARRGGGQFQSYDAFAAASSYSSGEVLYFPQVRHWHNKGELVEAWGKVVSIERFDNEVPYIIVSFKDPEVAKLNKVDLGDWTRNFLVELKV